MFNSTDKEIREKIDAVIKSTINTDSKIEAMAKLLLIHPALLKGNKGVAASKIGKYYDNKFLELVFVAVGCPNYASAQRKMGATLENLTIGHKYDQCDILEAYWFAKKCYGTVDVETGAIVPFIKYLNKILKFRRWKKYSKEILFADPLGFQSTQWMMYELIVKVAARHGKAIKKKEVGILTFEKARKYLEEFEATIMDFRDLQIIVDTMGTVNLETELKKENGSSGTLLADIHGYQKYRSEALALEKFNNLLESLLKIKAKGSKDKKIDLALDLLTLHIVGIEFTGDTKLLLEQLINVPLYQFAEKILAERKADKKWYINAYAKYLSLMPDTARKKLTVGKRYMQELQNA